MVDDSCAVRTLPRKVYDQNVIELVESIADTIGKTNGLYIDRPAFDGQNRTINVEMSDPSQEICDLTFMHHEDVSYIRSADKLNVVEVGETSWTA